jgi:RimJ/RimL family protein N-acetyltransferase
LWPGWYESRDVIDHERVTDGWPERLVVRPLTPDNAQEIAAWRYAGPWQVYDPMAEDGLLDSADGYRAVVGADEGRLVGFCCSGGEARVPGLEADPDLLDVGLGMAPAWVGGGHGFAFGQAVLDYFRRERPGVGLRAAVQSWNERSLRLTRHLGFVEVGRHNCTQNDRKVEYVLVVAT